jgi:uncharacterized protein YndB with AHSA1/START domain
VKIRESIYIEAPPIKVWPYLVEPKRILEWYTTFHSFKYTDKSRGVGSTFSAEEKIPAHYVSIDFKITELDRNRKFAFSIVAEDINRKYGQVWSIEPALSGCKFTVQENVQFPYRIFGGVIEFISQFSARANKRRMLARLKRLVEA